MSAIETAIIIPFRNEPYLLTMLDQIETTADCPYHIYLVSDYPTHEAEPDDVLKYADDNTFATLLHSHATGLSYARHVGLQAARAAGHVVAVLLDAHMSFLPDSGWLSRMSVHARNNPDSFFSAACVRCNEENMSVSYHLARGRYECGANMVLRQLRGTDRPIPEFFARRWRGDRDLKKVHTVACPLGGAYGLSIDWYFDACHAPWRYHIGWGASEQFVALATWFAGGKCESVPIPIGHMFRRVPTVNTRWWKVVYNNLLLMEFFAAEQVGHQLFEWALSWRPNDVRKATERIDAIKSDILAMRTLYDPDRTDVLDLLHGPLVGLATKREHARFFDGRVSTVTGERITDNYKCEDDGVVK